MKRAVELTVEIDPNVLNFVKPENLTEHVKLAVEQALTSPYFVPSLVGLKFTVTHAYEPLPECICDGGEQGEGLMSIPHEPHCPRRFHP